MRNEGCCQTGFFTIRIFTFVCGQHSLRGRIDKAMEPTQRLLRLVQLSMLMSIVLFTAVGEMASRSIPSNTTIFYALSLLAISTLGVALVVRRTLVSPCEALLREKPNDTLLLARWRTGYLVLYSLCEALAAFGLVLRISGFDLAHVWGFYAGGFLLMILFSPPPSHNVQPRSH